MFNFNNLSGFVSANNFVSIVGNRNGSEYTPDALNLQVGLLNAGGKIQLSSSYSARVGGNVQLGILSGLAESLIAVDSVLINVNHSNSFYLKGLADILAVNSGNGISGLTTNDAYKKKLDIPTSFATGITVPGKEVAAANNPSGGSTPVTTYHTYSSNSHLCNHYQTATQNLKSAWDAVSGDDDIATFKAAVANNDLTNHHVVLSSGTLHITKLAKLGEINKSTFTTKAHFDTWSQDFGINVNNHQTIDKIIRKALEFDNTDEAKCNSVNRITGIPCDAGSRTTQVPNTGGNPIPTSPTDVTFKVYQTSGTDISMNTIVSGTTSANLVYSKMKSDGTEIFSNENEFFSCVGNDEIKFENQQSKVIYLIGLFGERKEVTSRCVSIALIPQLDISGVYSSFSIQGLTFSEVGFSVKTPVLAMISETVNNWTFSALAPFAVNINTGGRDRGAAVGSFSSDILGVSADKSITDEVISKNSTDAFQTLVSKHGVKPFAEEDNNQWFAKNNYTFNVFGKLMNPVFNLFTAAELTYIIKGKSWLAGISIGTVYSFIKLV